jgi:hypothetical protein
MAEVALFERSQMRNDKKRYRAARVVALIAAGALATGIGVAPTRQRRHRITSPRLRGPR